MKAPPAAPLEVVETEFLLELLVIALDPPAQLGQPDEPVDWRVGREAGKPVLGGLGLLLRPLDQQPELGPGLGPLVIPVPWPNPDGGEAGSQLALGSLPPSHLLPSRRRQRQGQGLGANRRMLGIAAQQLWRPTAPRPRLGGQCGWMPTT